MHFFQHKDRLFDIHSIASVLDNRSLSLYKKSIIAFLLCVLGYGIYYFYNIVLAHYLIQENYGNFALITNMAVLVASLILCGNDLAANKFIPQYVMGKSTMQLQGLVRYYHWITIVPCITFFFASLLFSLYIPPIESLHSTNLLYLKYLWVIPAVALLTFFKASLQALNDYYISILTFHVFDYILIILGILVLGFFYKPISLNMAILLYTSSLVCIVFFQWVRLNHALPSCLKSNNNRQYHCRLWFFTGVQLMLSFIIVSNDISIATLMLTLFGAKAGEAENIAILNAAYVITSSFWICAAGCSAVLANKVSPALEANDQQKLQSLANIGCSIMFGLGCGLYLFLIVFGKLCLRHFGAQYEVGYPALLIISTANLLYLSTGLVTRIVEYSNTFMLLKINVIGAIVFLPIMAALCHFWGLLGGALSIFVIQAGSAAAYTLYLIKSQGIYPIRFGFKSS